MIKIASRLLLLGSIGIASLLLVPLERVLPIALPALIVRLLGTLQPAILMVAFTALGAWLAPKVGLDAPLVRARIERRPTRPILRHQLSAAIPVGLLAAAVILFYDAFYASELAVRDASPVAGLEIPLITRILYGGIVEELMLRWGAVSLFVWLMWKASRAGEAIPVWCHWFGMALAALLFAAGHLPLLFSVQSSPSAELVGAVLIANSAGGMLFGWLFWKRGLEAAVIAHALAHLFAAAAAAVLLS
ncbi:MAG TPA: CPBP family glutamic-type intramembrane protease [Allosphingosinicella sp.]|nr:CPBP family glutamic-type intramembrane protease [Allosphingosinicella sp.]